jgi:hypothetical protein
MDSDIIITINNAQGTQKNEESEFLEFKDFVYDPVPRCIIRGNRTP